MKSEDQNPFTRDVAAASDSPTYTCGEHRINLADENKTFEGKTYGKTLKMAVARAEFVARAVNKHEALVRAALEVVACWESGDLASAVRSLELVISS